MLRAVPGPERLVIRVGRFVDVLAGQVVAGRAIVVEGDRITGVVEDEAAPGEADVVDLSDYTVVPGLIDCHALRFVFSRYRVDARHVMLAGFSDGASYALSLGLVNGDVFTNLCAFSPGFVSDGERHGRPDVFIAHGVHDPVLPIDRTSRRIVPSLRRDGYDVTYVEFDGDHHVEPENQERAVRWFLA